MQISTLIIGTEILTGKITDSNGPWLIRQAQRNGLKFKSLCIINDDWEEFKAAMDQLIQYSEVIIISGGLGPTKDDKTKEFLARYFSLPIVFSEQAKQMAEHTYSRFSRNFADSAADYDHVPQGFICIDNPKGFAPPLHLKRGPKHIFSLPGVPREFQATIEEIILPMLSHENKEKAPARLNFRTKLIPEEKIFKELLPGLWNEFEKWGVPYSLPHTMGVDIGILVDQSKYKAALDYFTQFFNQSNIKDSIWQIGEISLEELVIQSAIEKNITIATAESCTGGLVGHRLTNITGSSAVITGGVISYANSLKINALKVDPSIIESMGAVSLDTSEQMAKGLHSLTGANLNISFTGIAGPSGGSESKPVGTVCIGIYHSKKGLIHNERYQFHGDREKLKDRFATMGLYLLLDLIKDS